MREQRAVRVLGRAMPEHAIVEHAGLDARRERRRDRHGEAVHDDEAAVRGAAPSIAPTSMAISYPPNSASSSSRIAGGGRRRKRRASTARFAFEVPHRRDRCRGRRNRRAADRSARASAARPRRCCRCPSRREPRVLPPSGTTCSSDLASAASASRHSSAVIAASTVRSRVPRRILASMNRGCGRNRRRRRRPRSKDPYPAAARAR